jgi:hypothetical protein
MRAEVEEALREWPVDDVDRHALRALIELGVRLAIEKCAEVAQEAYVPIVAYFGDDGAAALKNAADDIRAITVESVLEVRAKRDELERERDEARAALEQESTERAFFQAEMRRYAEELKEAQAALAAARKGEQDAAARVVELQAALTSQQQATDEAMRRAEEARRELAAVQSYVQHLPTCSSENGPGVACTCGLQQ